MSQGETFAIRGSDLPIWRSELVSKFPRATLSSAFILQLSLRLSDSSFFRAFLYFLTKIPYFLVSECQDLSSHRLLTISEFDPFLILSKTITRKTLWLLFLGKVMDFSGSSEWWWNLLRKLRERMKMKILSDFAPWICEFLFVNPFVL